MAYGETLAGRIRGLLPQREPVTERKMFGGLAFMLNGNMLCGIVGGDLMVRVGPQAYDDALARPHARPMDFTGRAMKGMVYVGPQGCSDEGSLRSWVELGLSFAGSLPAK